jgi:hypothetical protein
VDVQGGARSEPGQIGEDDDDADSDRVAVREEWVTSRVCRWGVWTLITRQYFFHDDDMPRCWKLPQWTLQENNVTTFVDEKSCLSTLFLSCVVQIKGFNKRRALPTEEVIPTIPITHGDKSKGQNKWSCWAGSCRSSMRSYVGDCPPRSGGE